MSSQIVNKLIEALSGDVEKEKLVNLKKEVAGVFSRQSNGLVDQVLEAFSSK